MSRHFVQITKGPDEHDLFEMSLDAIPTDVTIWFIQDDIHITALDLTPEVEYEDFTFSPRLMNRFMAQTVVFGVNPNVKVVSVAPTTTGNGDIVPSHLHSYNPLAPRLVNPPAPVQPAAPPTFPPTDKPTVAMIRELIDFHLNRWRTDGRVGAPPQIVLPQEWTVIPGNPPPAAGYTVRERMIMITYPVIPDPVLRQFWIVECAYCSESSCTSPRPFTC